jgi:hypothetical protein
MATQPPQPYEPGLPDEPHLPAPDFAPPPPDIDVPHLNPATPGPLPGSPVT